jgi:two-component system nitrogen regulation response regulator NtrX
MALDILIIDDEKDICHLIGDSLEDEGYTCRYALNADQAFQEVKKRRPHLVLLDIWLGDTKFDGLKILEILKADHETLPVLMMSGHGNIETAVSAIKKGAYDFLEKPFKTDRLLILVERALEATRLREENASLKKHVSSSGQEKGLIGTSAAIITVCEAINKVASTNSRVVIEGPHGSGKETVARLIHANSGRAQGAFVVVHCAGLEVENLEEKLFGREHESGFTAGVFERAHNGTLYLDAVDELTPELQAKMVKALQSNKFTRLGGKDQVEVDVRILCSSVRNLKELVDQGALREDLYYRLKVVTIIVPSLRERMEDIPALVAHFIQLLSYQHSVAEVQFDESALLALRQYHWPGNVRQLRNVIEWVMIMQAGKNKRTIALDDLPAEIVSQASDMLREPTSAKLIHLPLRDAREAFEKDYLVAQVDRFEGNISKTAQFIGMERSALHRKLKGLHISLTK